MLGFKERTSICFLLSFSPEQAKRTKTGKEQDRKPQGPLKTKVLDIKANIESAIEEVEWHAYIRDCTGGTRNNKIKLDKSADLVHTPPYLKSQMLPLTVQRANEHTIP